MTLRPGHSELNAWLEFATKGLPDSARRRVCEEMVDHYWSSITDYEEHGKSALEAHQQAMVELGDMREAHCAFRDAHASKVKYLLAGILSVAMPLLFALIFREEPEALAGAIPSQTPLVGLIYLLQPLALALPMLAIVYGGYSLLSYRFRFEMGKWRVMLPVAGLLITFAPNSLNGLWLLISGQRLFAEPSLLRQVIGGTGILLLSFGLLAISYRINKLGNSLYGMRSALVATSGVWGVSQAGLAFAHIENRVTLLVFLLIFTATAFCVFLGWMFIKAAFMGRLLSISDLGKRGNTTDI